MRAIIINSKEQTITEANVDGSLKTLQQIVGGLIDAVSAGLPEGHVCYVNDEGLLNNPEHFFMFKDGHQPLAGNGVIVSTRCDGDDAPCTLSIAWALVHVTFMDLRAAQKWAEQQQ
jgi:hypothetical protein